MRNQTVKWFPVLVYYQISNTVRKHVTSWAKQQWVHSSSSVLMWSERTCGGFYSSSFRTQICVCPNSKTIPICLDCLDFNQSPPSHTELNAKLNTGSIYSVLTTVCVYLSSASLNSAWSDVEHQLITISNVSRTFFHVTLKSVDSTCSSSSV